jgi:4-amino-4-deoxy-L-arabinose transferase-like glycosyltransferase
MVAARVRALRRAGQPDLLALAVLCGLAVAVRLVFLLRAPAFIVNDSHSYLLPGFDLTTGLGFAPIYKRPPAYPAFVGLALWYFGQQSLFGLLLLQHLLGVVTVGLTYWLGRLLFGRAAGWLAGLLTALSGPLIVTEHYIMSETLFGALLVGMLLVMTLALRRRSLGLLALGGLLLGLAALTRPVAQMLLPLFGLLALGAWPRRRRAVGAVAVLVVCYGGTVLPWMARNAAVQGSFTLAGGLGEGLAVRTIRLDQEFDFQPTTRPDPLRREREIYREEAEEGSAFELADRLQREAGLSPAEADRAMREIALGAIRQKAGYYVVGSLDMFLKMFAGRPVRLRQDWQPWRGIAWEERVQHLLPAATPQQELAFGVAQAVVTTYDPARWWPLVALLFAAGCVAAGWRSDRRLALLPPLTALALLLVSAFIIGIEWRYRYPLDPLLNVTIGGGAVALVGLVRRVWRDFPTSTRRGGREVVGRPHPT